MTARQRILRTVAGMALLMCTALMDCGGAGQGKKSAEVRLHPALQAGKWGYIDSSGTFLVSPQFDSAAGFAEGLAAVRSGGKFGYIDKTGKVVIDPQFDIAEDFSEGLALAGIRAQDSVTLGYIDRTGRLVVETPCVLTSPLPGPFRDGRAKVYVGDSVGFIDRTGRFIVRPQFYDAESFSEGLAAVGVWDTSQYSHIGGEWGFIDTSGAFVMRPQFKRALPFSGGLAAVWIGDWDEIQSGYVDKAGKFAISPRYGMAASFSEGLAAFYAGGSWGFIDTTGGFVIQPRFDELGDYGAGYLFSEGLAPVIFVGKWCYIDTTGEFATTPQFERAYPFRDGLGSVEVGDSCGYVDRTGKVIIMWTKKPASVAAVPPPEEQQDTRDEANSPSHRPTTEFAEPDEGGPEGPEVDDGQEVAPAQNSVPVVPFWKVDVKPSPANIPSPEYPVAARDAGIEGEAVVEALVDSDGRIAETKITKTSGYESLDSSACAAARLAAFSPARHKGQAVRVWVNIPYRFDLK